MHHPEAGRMEACAKMYLANTGASRGLLNEISAYILGRALGVPMAEHAFVCMIPLAKLKSPPVHHRWIKEELKQNKNADYPAFCTSRITGGDAVIEQSRVGPKVFANDLSQWPALSLATRFDQHVTNTDRHLGNLRRVSKHSYRLIDHGRLVTEDGEWNASDLNAASLTKHPDRLMQKAWPDGVPKRQVSEILLHLGFHETALAIALPELRWWWSRLTGAADATAFEGYLVSRAKALKSMFEIEYNQLSL
jgi:hypothetical protein